MIGHSNRFCEFDRRFYLFWSSFPQSFRCMDW